MKNLFINLLIKLGLIKIDATEYFHMLEKLLDELPKKILQNSNLSDDDYNKAICEIKIFLWVYSSPILDKHATLELFDKTMRFYRRNILFSTLDKDQYSEEYLEKLIQERLDFHNNGLEIIGKSSISNNYFQDLKVLVFEQPFIDLEELSQHKVLSFDIFNNFSGQAEGQLLYIHVVPEYIKALKKLILMTKK